MKRQARDRDRTQTTDSTRITVDACEPHLGPIRDDLATDSGPAPETVRNAMPAGDTTVVDAPPITLRMLPLEAPRTVRLQLVPFVPHGAQSASPVEAPVAAEVQPPKPAPVSMLTMASAADMPSPAKRKSGPPPLPVEPAVVVRPSITDETLERHARTGPRLAPLPLVVAPAASAGPRSVRPARERAPRRAQLLHGLVAATVAAALLVMGVSIVLLAPAGKRETAAPSAALAGDTVQDAPSSPAPVAAATATATAHTVALSTPTLVVSNKAPKSVPVPPVVSAKGADTAPRAATRQPAPTPLAPS
ncbi:MAG: hypothetical protein HOO96_28835, partial [Polyangiaceae bacterium]|nr:hypothetical protein [Polyangiaceae bacterium]